MNQLEKIVSGYLLGGSTGVSSRIAAGQYVRVSPQHIMSHDNTAAIIPKFESLARNPTIHQPAQPVFALDHDIQNPNNFAGKYAAIKKFAQRHGVDFFPAGRGIGHQIMIEEAYALPGSMIVAPDSHSNMYGGVGCLGTPLTRTDAAVIWAIGNTWWKVPPVTRVVLTGSLPPGVTGKDVILALCSTFDSSRVLNHAIQFSGESAISSLSIEDRLTIANMTTEWGCLAGVFPVDDVLLTWLERRMNFLSDRGPAGTFSDPDRYLPEEKYYHPRLNPQSMLKITKSVSLNADPGARYAQTLEIDLSTVTPLVAGPNAVNNGIPISSLRENIHVDKAYILSCVNARNNDLQQAAAVLRGKKVADHVKLYVAAASSEVQERAVADGSWKVLQESGAIFLPSGCGPCIGLGAGLLADGEVGISATNRNFKGRMGSRSAQCYLSNPAIVAASAIAGRIVSVDGSISPVQAFAHSSSGCPTSSPDIERVPLSSGFPSRLAGPLLFCDSDSINTDAIYPGKYTYREDLSQEQMAAVALENYSIDGQRPTIEPGSIMVSGSNFGCGSSREQAATCLKYAGIPAVIVSSVNETYLRNAFNNGFLVLISPELVTFLRRPDSPTFNLNVVIDFLSWTVSLTTQEGEELGPFSVDPVGPVAQQLIVDEGIASSVKKALSQSINTL